MPAVNTPSPLPRMPPVSKTNTFCHHCLEGHPKDRPAGAICPVQKQGRVVYGEFKDNNKTDKKKVGLLFIVIMPWQF